MKTQSINSNLVEINATACALIFGGCWCNCFVVPFDYRQPSIVIGEKHNEQYCIRSCEAIHNVYAGCD